MDIILHKVAEFIREENKSLTKNLLMQATEELQLDLTDEQLAKHCELIGRLLDKVALGLISTRQETLDMEMDYDIDHYFYYDGTLLKNTVEIISTFRLSLLHELQERGVLENSSAAELSKLYHHVIYIFDDALRKTTTNFNLENQKLLDSNEQEIMELAAPIVPIRRGVGVMPLIGEFTDSRAAYLSTEVIPKVVDLDIEQLVIDFSGIHHFDTNVAQQIFQIRDLLQLLGIKPILTGIRPVIAHTAVSLGINMSDMQAYGTVKEFLELTEH